MGDSCRCCKEELTPRNFLLDYTVPSRFIKFECGYNVLYLIWRVFWALYHVVWIILTGVFSWQWAGYGAAEQIKWFIYLTNWCYFVLTMATLVDAIVVIYVWLQRPDIKQGLSTTMTWYLKADWVMFNVANSSSLLVSLLYWILLYSASSNMTAVNIATHALNALYVIVNVLLAGTPVRLYHFFHSIVFAVIYVLFTLIYYLAGGTNERGKPYVYSTIDWRNTGYTVGLSVGVTFVAMPLCHLLFWGLFQLRLVLFRCCRENTKSSDMSLEKVP